MSAEQTHPIAAPILGILKDIEDPGSGAVAGYHVVVAYQVMLQHGGSAVVTFGSYVSRATHESGKTPLAHVTLPLKAAPTGDSATWPHWFAERVLANEVTLVGGQTEHPLQGGVAVYGEVPSA